MNRFIALGAACALCLASCAALVEQRAETVIAEALTSTLGPAARYDVRVEGAQSGGLRFARVHVVGTRVERPGAPVIDWLQADLSDVIVDREARRLISIGNAKLQAHVRSKDLAAYLVDRGWVENARVSLKQAAEVIVTGVPRIAGFVVPGIAPVEFRGRALARGSQLRLSVDSVRIGGFEAPAFVRVLFEERLNPIFDTSTYAVPSTIDFVRVEGDALAVSASGVQVTAPGKFPAAGASHRLDAIR